MKSIRIYITLALFLTIILFSSAQESQKFKIVFNHVALSVKDLTESANFYKQVMGLNEITNRTEKEGIRWFSLGEDKELHLISVDPGKIELTKAVHFAVAVTNFNEFFDNLNTREIKYLSWDGEENKVTVRADGIQQVYIQDPDGYYIEVNSAGK